MRSVKNRYTSLCDALAAFEQALSLLDTKEAEKYPRTFRDSAIQSFEFSIELFWKFLREFLEEKRGITFDTVASKIVFRNALQQNILTESEHHNLIEALEDRNVASHIYKEEFAEELVKKLPKHFKVMKTVLTRIEKELE